MDVFELPDPEPQDYTVTIVVVIVLLVLIIIVAGNSIIIWIIMSSFYQYDCLSVPHSPCQEQQQMVLQQWWK